MSPKTLDGGDLVDQYWPVTGPIDIESITAAAVRQDASAGVAIHQPWIRPQGIARFAQAGVYRMEPPILVDPDDLDSAQAMLVMVSAQISEFGPETMIFPATATGWVTTWTEIPNGTIRGVRSHRKALTAAGYTVIGKTAQE